MTTQDPFRDDERPEEAELRALFDATADEPSPDTLHRLARTAALIPEREAPSPLRAWLRRLAPALGLAAAATAGWFLLASPDGDDGVGSPAPTTTLASSEAVEAPTHPEQSSPMRWVDEEQEELALAVLSGETEDDPDEDLGGELDDPVASLGMVAVDSHPMDALAVLFPPEGDEEALEIYADALGAFIEEDG